MPYQRVRCSRGHTFHAHIYSSTQRVECPDCKRLHAAGVTRGDAMASAIDTPPASFNFASYDTPPASESFSSGSGGDFGGGGATGDF